MLLITRSKWGLRSLLGVKLLGFLTSEWLGNVGGVVWKNSSRRNFLQN